MAISIFAMLVLITIFLTTAYFLIQKRFLIALACAGIPTIVIFAGVWLFNQPIPIIAPGSSAEVLYITYERGRDRIELVDIMDMEEVVEILRGHYVRRTWGDGLMGQGFGGIRNEMWSILLFGESGHIYISLGRNNIMRGSSRNFHYTILDPERLIEELYSAKIRD